MLLVFYGPGADGHVGKQIVEIFIVFRIEHFIGTGQSDIADDAHVELSGGDDAFEHIRFFFGIGLVKKALITVTCCSGFIRIHTGNDQDFFLHLFLDARKALKVIHDTVFVVSRAGADDEEKFVASSGKNLLNLGIALFFDSAHVSGQGIHFLDLHGDCQFPFEFHIHTINLFFTSADGLMS